MARRTSLCTGARLPDDTDYRTTTEHYEACLVDWPNAGDAERLTIIAYSVRASRTSSSLLIFS